MTARVALACLILPLALIFPACGKKDTPAPTPQAATGVRLQGDYSGTGPGTLLDARSLPTIDRRLPAGMSIAGRIEYTSTSGITNSETAVTGTVFAPKAEAPAEGWPIITFGHGSAGIQPDCAPSLSPSLMGLAAPVAQLVQAGYVVVLPDFQGLGNNKSYSPYLEPKTAGYNMIDAVRAARKLVPNTSERWVAAGFSQGAQAAWAADELAPTYGKGLTLVGSVALAPPLDLTFVADTAAQGKLDRDQLSIYLNILASLKNSHPEFNLDDYRHGLVKDRWDILVQCDIAHQADRDKVFDQIAADDLRPVSAAATDELRDRLHQMSLPQQTATAPLLVVYGSKDQIISVEATNGALAAACRMGDVIDIRLQPDKGHTDLDIGVAVPWIADRFTDEPVTNSCVAPAPTERPSETGGVPQPDEVDAPVPTP
jgi:pimeloyl-ACP methyl ester carboxylesterase